MGSMKVPSNKLTDLIVFYQRQLEQHYTSREASNIVREIIAHFLGINRLELALNPEIRVSESEMLMVHFAIKDLLKGKPLQYVTGLAWFDGHQFLVNEHVLIPRQETEGLLNLASEFLENYPNARVLDACTGSGCIAISIKLRHPQTYVVGTDVSENALEVARINAENLKVQIVFYKDDLLSGHQALEPQYNLIVSNPPYVPESERASLPIHVLAEPESAIFVPDHSPIIFYKALADTAFKHLAHGGLLAVECHTLQTDNVAQLFMGSGLMEVAVYDDHHGRSRFVTAKK
jgi:release factor glutamine methyltransferase